jgi:hypothetical protein
MKAYFLFTASGPLVILTSYESIETPKLLGRLALKGIDKFVAFEVPVPVAQKKYGTHFEIVCGDLHETDDLRVLDYSGERTFNRFRFAELSEPVFHEPPGPNSIGQLAYIDTPTD